MKQRDPTDPIELTEPNEDLIPILIGVFMDHIQMMSPRDGVKITLTAEQARAIGDGLRHAADILDSIDNGMKQGGVN